MVVIQNQIQLRKKTQKKNDFRVDSPSIPNIQVKKTEKFSPNN